MNTRMTPGRFVQPAVLAATSYLIVSMLHLPAAEPDATAKDAKAAVTPKLAGAWVCIGAPGQITEPPRSGGGLKFYSETHFMVSISNPATGDVRYHHGGTYVVEDGQLFETIQYATEATKHLIGTTFQFKITAEGDTFTQIGIGNDIKEVFKRLK